MRCGKRPWSRPAEAAVEVAGLVQHGRWPIGKELMSESTTNGGPFASLLPLGVAAETGRPLEGLTEATVNAWLAAETAPPEALALQARSAPTAAAFAVMGDIDSNKLQESGWGVLFAPGVDPRIREALKPLLDHRRAEVGDDRLFRVFEDDAQPRPGESALDWLARMGVGLDVVDPLAGVPFYLLIVAPPEAVPFEFQYTLDLYWAVGRLWFPTVDEFRQYADSVIGYEKSVVVLTSRRAALFATSHDFDLATQLFTQQVATPLWEGDDRYPPFGSRRQFAQTTLMGPKATRSGLAELLRGGAPGGSPALLFSGTHGMVFPSDDPRQAEGQGALVCDDWPGYGGIEREHWFSGEDVPADSRIHGMIHFLFACFGAGCPALDDFDRLGAEPKRMAAKPFLSRLPQALLAHPNGGALAVLGHVERAWSYSFQTTRGASRLQGFRDVLGRLLIGQRVGQATDQFNLRWAALSTGLSERLNDERRGVPVSRQELAQLWVARDDARNYIILGDPAVRLRVEKMAPG